MVLQTLQDTDLCFLKPSNVMVYREESCYMAFQSIMSELQIQEA